MADDKPSDSTPPEEDEELSALLDSAVADFDTVAKTESKKTEEKTTADATPKPAPPDTLWTDEFIRNNRNLSSLFSPGPDGTFNMESLEQELQRLTDATTQAAGFDATSPDAEFSNIIAQTLRNLSESTQDIQGQLSDADIMNMLGSLGNMSDDQDPGELMPFMQKMMQNLLSKEILHPALATLAEKYPSWLDENRPQLSPEDLTRYEKQSSKVREICAEFDRETEQDSEEVKKLRFERVLVLMQDMQDCGQPPAELVGEAGPFLDEQGRPQMPPGISPDQCVIQ